MEPIQSDTNFMNRLPLLTQESGSPIFEGGDAPSFNSNLDFFGQMDSKSENTSGILSQLGLF